MTRLQLALPGADPPRVSLDTLFFALQPAADTADHIAQLASQLRADCGVHGKLRPTEVFHVTLHFLGGFAGLPRTLIEDASRAAAILSMPAFDVEFDRALSFSGRPRNVPLVLAGGEGVAGVTALYDALGKELLKAAVRTLGGGSGYTPHLTLLHGDRAITERRVSAVRWRVREFVLVRSFHGQGRHEVLQRFALGG